MTSFSSAIKPNYMDDVDYGRGFNKWHTGALYIQPTGIRPAKDYGLKLPIGNDLAYFEAGFGNITQASLEGNVKCSLNSVGEFISRAYNTQAATNAFMNTQFDASSQDDLGFMYSTLRDFVIKQAKTKGEFELQGFVTGMLPSKAGAAIFGDSKNLYLGRANDFAKRFKSLADKYNAKYSTAELYVLMHEFTHLFGVSGRVSGDTIAAEAQLEELIEKLIFGSKSSKGLLDQVKEARTYNDQRRIELTAMLRAIGRIAKDRKETVENNYGTKYDSRINTFMSDSQIESIISELMEEAADMNMTEEGVKEYVAAHLDEKIREYEASDKENEHEKTSENSEQDSAPEHAETVDTNASESPSSE